MKINPLFQTILFAMAGLLSLGSQFVGGGYFVPTISTDSAVVSEGVSAGIGYLVRLFGVGSLGALPDPLSLAVLSLVLALSLGRSKATGFLVATLGVLGLVSCVPSYLIWGDNLLPVIFAGLGALSFMAAGFLGAGFRHSQLRDAPVDDKKPDLVTFVLRLPATVLGWAVGYCDVRKPRFLSRVSVVLLWVLAAKLLGALVGVLWLVVLPVATFIVMWAVIIAVVGYIALQVLASMADNRTPEQKAADAQAKKDAEDAAKAEAQAARLALCHELMKIDRPWEDLPDREEIYDTEGTLVGTRVKGKDSYFKVLDGEGKVLGEARVEFKKANLVRAYDELKVFDTADKSGEPVVFLSQAQYGNQHVSYQGDPGLFDSAAKKVTSELDADKEGLYVRETDKVSGESTTSRRVGETWGNPAHTETTKEKK